MGGSGRGFSGYGEISARAQMLASKQETQASQRELEINRFLESLLKDFNNRDVDAIQIHLKEIEKVLGREIDGLDAIYMEVQYQKIHLSKELAMLMHWCF